MKPQDSSSARQREAEMTLREAEARRTSALLSFQAASKAAEAKNQRVRQTLNKLRTKQVKSWVAKTIERAGQTIAMRYAADSFLRQIDVRSFTILVERVNIRVLREFRDRGLPEAVVKRTQEMPLPEPFWVEYHAQIRRSGNNLQGKLYFMEISDFVYPPLMPDPDQDVLYTLAYSHKSALTKYFVPSFLKRMEALPTWGTTTDKTTSCIRAHCVPRGVDFEIDLGGGNPALSLSDVLRRPIAAYEGVYMQTRKVNQLVVHVPLKLGQEMVRDLV